MAKVLVVTSGKGGVGKTTSTASLGAALAQMEERLVVIDFDGDLPMSLDPGDGIDNEFGSHVRPLRVSQTG